MVRATSRSEADRGWLQRLVRAVTDLRLIALLSQTNLVCIGLNRFDALSFEFDKKPIRLSWKSLEDKSMRE